MRTGKRFDDPGPALLLVLESREISRERFPRTLLLDALPTPSDAEDIL
jgi:hypothetical protein